MKERICLSCGLKFLTRYYNWHRLNGRKKFCSRKCRSNSQKKAKVEITCETCGKKFKVYPSRVKRARFCSLHCNVLTTLGPHGYWLGKKRPELKNTNASKTMFKTEDVIGSNNPNWKGGITETNWSLRHTSKYLKFRKDVLERDRYKCILCGDTNKLHVDHIVPFSISEEKRLDTTNGRVLCRKCHLKSPTWGGRVKNFTVKEVVSYA